uniref:Uncharacterized protein n=1 Tax=Rhizophora mucronata TaxID=61149 RepID=A0A2P2NJS1_RHIMU
MWGLAERRSERFGGD